MEWEDLDFRLRFPENLYRVDMYKNKECVNCAYYGSPACSPLVDSLGEMAEIGVDEDTIFNLSLSEFIIEEPCEDFKEYSYEVTVSESLLTTKD